MNARFIQKLGKLCLKKIRQFPLHGQWLLPGSSPRWIEDCVARNPGSQLFQVSDAEKFFLQDPVEGFQSPIEIPPSFVATIPQASVYSHKGVVICPDSSVVRELLVYDEPLDHPPFTRWMIKQPTYVRGNIAVIAGVGPEYYYHWMVETLPRIEMVRKSGCRIDYYYLPQLKFPYQRLSIERLGIKPEQIITGDRKTHIRPDLLVIPTLPTKYRIHPINPQWVNDWLRSLFLPSLLPKAHCKVYISRAKARTRRFLNENEVWSYLASQGYEKVFLEDLSLYEQACLFAKSTHIVAPHGGGLTNLIFANPATRVLEIECPTFGCKCFPIMANQVGYIYRDLMGLPPDDHKLIERQDFWVDMPKLKQIINEW